MAHECTEIQGTFSLFNMETGITCTCSENTEYLAHGNSNGKIRERSKHQYNIKREVNNVEERNVDTKKKSFNQALTISKEYRYLCISILI